MFRVAELIGNRKMRKTKNISPDEKSENPDIKFCIVCGEALDDFDISKDAENSDAVKKNFQNCKATGRFCGDVCAKVFISSNYEPDPFLNEE